MVPVILPDAPAEPELPIFLNTKTWVNMRQWQMPKDESFFRLMCGVLGKEPGDYPAKRFGVRDVAEE